MTNQDLEGRGGGGVLGIQNWWGRDHKKEEKMSSEFGGGGGAKFHLVPLHPPLF